MYLLGPPVALLLNPKPRWRLPAIRIGAVLTVVALLASSFAKTVSPDVRRGIGAGVELIWWTFRQPWQLLLTQGVLYSIGGSIVCKLSSPSVDRALADLPANSQTTRPSPSSPNGSSLEEVSPMECASPAQQVSRSFDLRWPFFGASSSADSRPSPRSTAGGLVYPFVLEALLSRYGAAVTLQALVRLSLFLCALLSPRLTSPPSPFTGSNNFPPPPPRSPSPPPSSPLTTSQPLALLSHSSSSSR
jgi:hypothetical protein